MLTIAEVLAGDVGGTWNDVDLQLVARAVERHVRRRIARAVKELDPGSGLLPIVDVLAVVREERSGERE